MDLSRPLSDEEIEELEDFLVSDATPEDCMDISMLDGFLTAIVVGPNMIMPSQWLPQVWGEAPGQAMEWQSAAQAERMTGLVMRHMNDIIWQLDNEPDDYEPLIYLDDQEGETIPVIDEWCTGFIHGAMLDEAWAPLFDSDDNQVYLLPIILYGTEGGWQQLEEKPELAERHAELAAALPGCVLAIREHWRRERKSRSTIRHAEPVPGRNDPCPCGSGKKFKKCCGDPGRMH